MLDAVGDHHEQLLAFVHQNHEGEVSDSFLRELGLGDQFETLHLRPVRGIAHHVHVAQFGQITVTVRRVDFFLFEGDADLRGLFLDYGSLVGGGLTLAHLSDQVSVEGGRAGGVGRA